MKFEDLGLAPEILDVVRNAGYDAPTPVQAQTIPIALQGKDVIASAQTGTGKTASFVLPMVEKLRGRQGTYGLILAPTREIAQQIQASIEIFGKPLGVRSIVLIGGIHMRLDEQAINTYPQIIVATPGRLCDHLDRGNIWLEYIQMVVLDEADRMLDMGFTDQLSRIMQDVPASRQTMLFSATFTASVEKLARKILQNPERVAIGKPQSAAPTVEQSVRWMSDSEKTRELRKIIQQETGSIIVFTRSKIGATNVWRSLHSSGVYDATYIHSDRLQAHREQALAEFKEGKYRILIATDVAARGIHVEGVAHVVNFDLPMEPEDYVHRIGRTGRAGATGKATTFVTPKDRGMIKQIEKLLGMEIGGSNGGAASEPRPEVSAAPAMTIKPRAPGTAAPQERPARPARSASPSPVQASGPSSLPASVPAPIQAHANRSQESGERNGVATSRKSGRAPRENQDGGERRPEASVRGPIKPAFPVDDDDSSPLPEWEEADQEAPVLEAGPTQAEEGVAKKRRRRRRRGPRSGQAPSDSNTPPQG